MHGNANSRDNGNGMGPGAGSSCHYAPSRGGEEGTSLGADETWHYAKALATLGSAVLQECQRAGTVGNITPGTLVGRAVELGLVTVDPDGIKVRSRL